MSEKRKQEGSSDKAAKKAKFFSTNKGVTLPLNTRGILISCIPNKAKLAGQEAIRVLLPYYEELVPSLKADDGGRKDISSLLAEEVADLKDPKKQIFKLHETGIHSLVYVSMADDAPGPGPSQLVQAIAEDIHRTRQCKVRLCMRFTPIEAVCSVGLESIKEAAEAVVWPRFNSASSGGLKFAVAYEHRASAGLDRLTVIKTVADGIKQELSSGRCGKPGNLSLTLAAHRTLQCHIRELPKAGFALQPPHKADLSNPDLTILVQIVKDACAVGVAAKYKQLAKYNLRELCNPEADINKAVKGADKEAKPTPERPQDEAEVEETKKGVESASKEGNGQQGTEDIEKTVPNPERPVDAAEVAEAGSGGGFVRREGEDKGIEKLEKTAPNPERPLDKAELAGNRTA